MGYPQAALHQAEVVPVAAARMACEIQCRLTTGHLAIDAQANSSWRQSCSTRSKTICTRAIECGALVDPWNILGFQGQFSLFPSPENSVPDHRLDQLIELVEQILGLYARLWSEAAARDDGPLQTVASLSGWRSSTRWWDQFATATVEAIEAFSGAEAFDSAREVAEALPGLSSGRRGGRRHRLLAEARVALQLAQGLCPGGRRAVAKARPGGGHGAAHAMAQPGRADSAQAGRIFVSWPGPALAERGLPCERRGPQAAEPSGRHERQTLIRKFFELLEANAEDIWQVPTLDLLGIAQRPRGRTKSSTSRTRMTRKTTTARTCIAPPTTTSSTSTARATASKPTCSNRVGAGHRFRVGAESRRIGERLAFLRTVASLWKKAVLACGPCSHVADRLRDAASAGWNRPRTTSGDC